LTIRINRARWFAPVWILACASVVSGLLAAESVLTKAAFITSLAGLGGAAILLGWRLTSELERRNDRLLALAGIVETTGEAVIAARLDRTITAWNAGAERLFGYTADEMIGASVTQIAPPGDEHTVQEHLEHMLEKDGMHTYEVERMHKSGELIDVAITLSPLRGKDGRIVGVSSILRDVSDRKKLEAERERLLARERNARADRLLRLVGDLLFVAQLKSSTVVLERAPVDLTELVGSAVQSVAPLAQDRGIELTLDCEALPQLEGDAGRLGQVLDNLLTNALKFTPRDGRVEVRAVERDEIVRFQVRDTGMGISNEDQQHLFEKFFRTSEAQTKAIQGTGLGLSIVAAIVEAHGGSIEVESELGVGTTFTVALPVERAERALAA
jgi:PAS domain S-box-containing protein